MFFFCFSPARFYDSTHGGSDLCPQDIPELIVAAGQQPAEPWHLKQAREVREREVSLLNSGRKLAAGRGILTLILGVKSQGFEYAKEAKHKAGSHLSIS